MFDFLKDKNVKVKFMFTQQYREQHLDWDDEITLYKMATGEKLIDPQSIKFLTAHLMVDENNQPVPEEKALKILGKMNKPDRDEVFAKLGQAIRDNAFPNLTGSDSNLPSTAGQETATLPNGSTP